MDLNYCRDCKRNGFNPVKIPSRKPYLCERCYDIFRVDFDDTWDQIIYAYENRYGKDWYDY
jgi:hypothetical protein|tara:strand:+ start:7044 stop:7226 length:183 start_codon:yes stop_codon:yes gene_type:complete